MCTAVLFLIGLKGPGMPTNPYAALRDEDEEGKVTHNREFSLGAEFRPHSQL